VVDGIVGNNTWAALDAMQKTTHSTLRSGNKGTQVKQLQQILSNLGYNPGPIDGIFGPKTDSAVRAFQSAHNLVVNGIVGNTTWTALGA
jgi:peptidoglycan hydrolase-like protein with peptidoglycan-binding domain